MSFVTTLPGPAGRATPRSHAGAAGLFATLRLWRSRARERAELARFSERELHDIGISHSDALQEINKPFWRP
ncbi:MAG: DUF1127 domain-containing protein [Alphaproteobacteria bacterium]|nr:DUF1127 domain-containing protein [Alphaproteobacteria bacterium]